MRREHRVGRDSGRASVLRWSRMSEHDGSQSGDTRGDADTTLMGVAPPKIESAPSPLRSPVFVRSGTSIVDVESPPVSRTALPSPSPRASAADSDAAVQLGATRERTTQGQLALRYIQAHPALWMLLTPGLIAVSAIALLHATGSRHATNPVRVPAAPSSVAAAPSAMVVADRPSANELKLANARSDALRASAQAVRSKIEANPALGKDPALQSELLRLADDARTSNDALAAMAALEAPIGADLLYEVWTRTAVRSDATDLARALVYSADVRAKASPALGVALELRSAETCEQFKAALPKALKDGDRRAVSPLVKLSSKRGCGPKKSADCYACLREPSDELKATISAAKSRRAPSYGEQ